MNTGAVVSILLFCSIIVAIAVAVYEFYLKGSTTNVALTDSTTNVDTGPKFTALLPATSVTALDTDEKIKTAIPDFGSNPTSYSISMWLKIPTLSGTWRNIFRFGSTDSVRCPGMWVVPNQNQIHYRHDVPGAPNWGFEGLPTNVALNTWFHFAMTVQDKVFTPYINGVAQTAMTAPATPSAADKSANQCVIVAKPGSGVYRDPASILQVCDLRFYPMVLNSAQLTGLVTAKPTMLT